MPAKQAASPTPSTGVEPPVLVAPQSWLNADAALTVTLACWPGGPAAAGSHVHWRGSAAVVPGPTATPSAVVTSVCVSRLHGSTAGATAALAGATEVADANGAPAAAEAAGGAVTNPPVDALPQPAAIRPAATSAAPRDQIDRQPASEWERFMDANTNQPRLAGRDCRALAVCAATEAPGQPAGSPMLDRWQPHSCRCLQVGRRWVHILDRGQALTA